MECPRITWQGSMTADFIFLAGMLFLWLSSGLPHTLGEQSDWDLTSWFFLSSLWAVIARFRKNTKQSLLKLLKSLIIHSFFFLSLWTLAKPLCPSSMNSLSLPLTLISPAAPSLCSPRERKKSGVLETKQKTTWGKEKKCCDHCRRWKDG